ncbi:putative Cyclin-dependent kinase D-1 [Hypsibius exemplaris]|uniref:Cyclin-dependent kinase D-1 n=1 Tax=Hypsibius exemplaris TaxID=2072580 RepID=A0A9X6NCB4_HYPEX|nr:putative Cyclin-dependent kinase D-1 [Hypsibius exemplaris]
MAPVSRGSFGTVYYALTSTTATTATAAPSATDKKPLQVALKEVHVSKTSSSRQRAPRHENEAEIQSKLEHERVVRLLRYWRNGDGLNMVFEWMECNLAHFLKTKKVLESVKKTYMHMLLEAVEYIHGRNIMHRDINPRNILVASSGIIKLGDFGLARDLSYSTRTLLEETSLDGFSSSAGTRQYRAPELLFGATNYDQKVDLWSCGCSCAEIYTNGQVLLRSETDIGQLGTVLGIFGDPVTQNGFEGARQWPDYGKLVFKLPKVPPGLTAPLPNAPVVFLDFLNGFFSYDPGKRISAHLALENLYFTDEITPCPVGKLPHPKAKKDMHKRMSAGLKKSANPSVVAYEARSEKKNKSSRPPRRNSSPMTVTTEWREHHRLNVPRCTYQLSGLCWKAVGEEIMHKFSVDRVLEMFECFLDRHESMDTYMKHYIELCEIGEFFDRLERTLRRYAERNSSHPTALKFLLEHYRRRKPDDVDIRRRFHVTLLADDLLLAEDDTETKTICELIVPALGYRCHWTDSSCWTWMASIVRRVTYMTDDADAITCIIGHCNEVATYWNVLHFRFPERDQEDGKLLYVKIQVCWALYGAAHAFVGKGQALLSSKYRKKLAKRQSDLDEVHRILTAGQPANSNENEEFDADDLVDI